VDHIRRIGHHEEQMMKRIAAITLALLLVASVCFGWPRPILRFSYSCASGNDTSTTLLIHSNTTDGSAVFTDSARGPNSPHTITANGNVHHEADQAKFGSISIHFDGSDDYLSVADNTADWAFGADPFTVDCWILMPDTTFGTLLSNGNNEANKWTLRVVAGKLEFRYGLGALATSASTVSPSAWVHVAAERFGNTLYLYINGVKDAATADLSAVNLSSDATLKVGTQADLSNDYTGYIDEIRISKGIARYGGASFTPNSFAYCY
jgi:hypothetical protein